MQANRGRDTGPEVALRSLLHRAGLRFRVDFPLPFDRRRRADIVFTRAGLYVFVDGCFWHGCPDHFVMPKTREQFWRDKIEGNRARDANSDAHLLSDYVSATTNVGSGVNYKMFDYVMDSAGTTVVGVRIKLATQRQVSGRLVRLPDAAGAYALSAYPQNLGRMAAP